MPQGFLTTDEVAAIHGVSRGCVVQWIKSGDLEAEKVGPIYLIKEKDAQEYKRRPIPGRPPGKTV